MSFAVKLTKGSLLKVILSKRILAIKFGEVTEKKWQSQHHGFSFGCLKQKFLTLRFSSLRFMTSQSGVLQNKKTKKNKQIGDKTETVFVD